MRTINSQTTCLSLAIFMLVLAASSLAALADRIIPPQNLFRDPEFVRDFVGSYGFLSDIEPGVSPTESRMLVTIREQFEAGNFKQAEVDLVRFIKETEAPTDPEKEPQEISAAMVFVLGNLYFSADRKEEARRAFLEAIRRFPKFRRAHVNLGYLYVSKEDFDKAMAHFQQAVSLGEGNPRVYGLLGYTYLLKGKPLAAENAYRQAYLLDPDSRDWKLGLAQTLIQQEKMEEAAALLGTLIEEYPEDRDLWLQQTNALLAQEKKMEAAVNLEVLRMKGLASEGELTLLGNLYMDQGEPQLALYAYTAAMDGSENFELARSLKSARVLNDYGFPDKAEAFTQRVRARVGSSMSDEDLTELELVEAQIAQSAGDQKRVGEILEGLVKRDPTNGEVLTELGAYYGNLAKTEESEERRAELIRDAKTNLQLAAGIESSGYGGNLALGQLLVRERQYIKAMPPLERALELKPSESLKGYVGRVRRAADREQQRIEREEAEREARKEEEPLNESKE